MEGASGVIWIAAVVAGIYLAAPVLCLFYLAILLRKDVRLVRFEHWYAARFELISTKSRYARAWKHWAGVGLWGFMITNDASDRAVRHEGRHCWWWMIAGGFYGIVYGGDWLRIKLFTDRDAYRDNVCERDARRFAGQPA